MKNNIHNKINSQLAENCLPLLDSQASLYVISSDESGSVAYNMSSAFLIQGEFNIDKAKQAAQQLVDRHDALRTAFFQDANGEFYQKIIAYCPAQFDVIKASEPYQERMDIDRFIREENHRPFDLASAPLIRFSVVEFTNDFYLFMTTAHHIIGDKASNDILIEEFNALYSDHEIPPAESFKTFIRDYPEPDEMILNEWQNSLKDAPISIDLPYDHRKTLKRSFKGGQVQIEVPKEMEPLIEKVCKEHLITPYMLFFAAFSWTLKVFSRESTMVIASPVGNRSEKIYENIFGYLADLMPLKISTENATTFLELIKSVRVEVIKGLSNQPCSFYHILKKLGNSASNQTPFTQVIFLYENYLKNSLNIPNASCRKIFPNLKTSQADLMCTFVNDQHRHRCILNYDAKLFKEGTMLSFSQTLLKVIEQVIEDPKINLAKINYSQKTVVLPGQIHKKNCLHQLFDNMAEKFSSRVAVSSNEKSVSYSELKRLSDQLATGIVKEMKCRDSSTSTDQARIALFMEPSIELIVSILAILKAGAAYVPIDPYTPEERIRYICEHSKSLFILTHNNLYTGSSNVQCYEKLINNPPNQHHFDDADALAYVIYTSGTTGKPKGVQITHHNVSRLLQSTLDVLNFSHEDIWLLFHSYAFDVSVWEIFGALLHGGKLVIPNFFEIRNPELLLPTLNGITILNQTPSAFYQLMSYLLENKLPIPHSLRMICFAGENLSMDKVRAWSDRYGLDQVLFVNLYGITETTVHVTHKILGEEDLQNLHYSPVGVPIKDMFVDIVDEYGNNLPFGFPGEMYVAGEGLSPGYLFNQELNEVKFITKGDNRFYRSGDLGRKRQNGELEYIGRIDTQVKVRGFRIELDEIINVLNQCESIADSAVTVKKYHENDFIIAYYVSDEEQDASILKERLKRFLPGYMIPHQFLRIEKIPLNANGKIDLKKLPVPFFEQEKDSISQEIELNTLQKQVRDFLQFLIGCKNIDLNKNFFEVGGDSLLAFKLVAKLKNLSIKVEIEDLYNKKLMDILSVDSGSSRVQGIEKYSLIDEKQKAQLPEYVRDALPLSAIQNQYLLFEKRNGRHPVQSYLIHLPFNEGVLSSALETIAEEVSAIRSAVMNGNQSILTLQQYAKIPLIVMGQSLTDAEMRDWIETESDNPFNYHFPPLLRVYIHKTADSSRFILSLSYSSVIFDEESSHLLLEKIILEYANLMGFSFGKFVNNQEKNQISHEQFLLKDAKNERNLFSEYDRPCNLIIERFSECHYLTGIEHYCKANNKNQEDFLFSAYRSCIEEISKKIPCRLFQLQKLQTFNDNEDTIGQYLHLNELQTEIRDTSQFDDRSIAIFQRINMPQIFKKQKYGTLVEHIHQYVPTLFNHQLNINFVGCNVLSITSINKNENMLSLAGYLEKIKNETKSLSLLGGQQCNIL